MGREINSRMEDRRFKGQRLMGRQMIKKIYEANALDEEAGAVYAIEDLLDVALEGDNLEQFLVYWDSILAGQDINRDD